jgi:tetratricopeptide (TPR) repeat protein
VKRGLTILITACLCAGQLSAQQAFVTGDVEAISLLGDSLRRPVLPPATEARLRQQLADAEAELASHPRSADAAIWVGRRLGYLGHYREAIAVFSRGVSEHPSDARFYRHRGHRYITVRRFERAIDDLLYAVTLTRGKPDVVEPDGAPNARNIPVSSLQSNIRYHLALAYYLKADFRNAARWWGEDLRRARNNDTKVAAGYWLYLSLRRMGQSGQAAEVLKQFRPGMEIIENDAYYRMLLFFKGDLPRDSVATPGDADQALQDATVGYGLGAWDWVNGRRDAAMQTWRAILEGGSWASFGYIAAEADVARRR